MCAWLHGSCIVLVGDVADLKIRDAERMGECSQVDLPLNQLAKNVQRRL